MVGRVVLFRYEISSSNPYSFGRYENISMISDVLVFITFVIAELFFVLLYVFENFVPTRHFTSYENSRKDTKSRR
jgi:hypothetical protein